MRTLFQSKKVYSVPYSGKKNVIENDTLWGSTYLYGRTTPAPPPPPPQILK